jgi:hypothetical protein
VSSVRDVLHELVRADEQHAATLAELDALAARVDEAGAGAGHVAALLERAPAEGERLGAEVEEAERDVAERAGALRDAEAELERVAGGRDREREQAARREVVRARDALSMGEKRLESARKAVSEHERRVEEARRQAPELERQAARLADELCGRPRLAPDAGRAPAPGLAGVTAWASSARAALAVARGGAAAERDAIVRQANELASAVLGEPQAAASAAAVAARAERALAAE